MNLDSCLYIYPLLSNGKNSPFVHTFPSSSLVQCSGWELKKKARDFPGGAVVKNRLPMQGTRVQALVWEDPHAAGQLSPYATTTEPAL